MTEMWSSLDEAQAEEPMSVFEDQLIATVGKQDAEILTLRSRLSEALAMLNRLQWANTMNNGHCMICDGHHHFGHAPDCRLKAVLEG